MWILQWPTARISWPDPQKSGDICLYTTSQPRSVAKLPSPTWIAALFQIQNVSEGLAVRCFMSWTGAPFCNVSYIFSSLHPEVRTTDWGICGRTLLLGNLLRPYLFHAPNGIMDWPPYLFPRDLICVWFFFMPTWNWPWGLCWVFDQSCQELDLFILFIWWWPPNGGPIFGKGIALMWALMCCRTQRREDQGSIIVGGEGKTITDVARSVGGASLGRLSFSEPLSLRHFIWPCTDGS